MSLKRIATSLAISLSIASTTANASVMLGAFVPGNGWDQTPMVDLESQMSGSMSFINVFSSFSESWDHLYWQSSKIADLGMNPMISWMPIDLSRKNTNILPEILVGEWDSYIDEWANRMDAWLNLYPVESRPNILMRFGHEFNGNWYSYGDSPELYQAAYRYVYDRLENHGVNSNLQWVWCANNVNVDQTNDITAYYPGDAYVDWTSIDGYNWGTNYTWTAWESFTEVFADSYNTLVTNYPEKPILIAEVGSTEPLDVPDASWGQYGTDSDQSEDKDFWNLQMLDSMQNTFPAIRGISLFNINKELSWSLTESNSTGMAGFNDGLSSGYFSDAYLYASDFQLIAEAPATEAPVKGKGKSKGNAKGKSQQRPGLSRRGIGGSEQAQLARSRALPQVDREKVDRRRNGFMNMSDTAKARLQALKLSVIE